MSPYLKKVWEKEDNFPSIISGWEELVKLSVKKLFIQQGKDKKNLQYGLMKYLEYKLRKQYETVN